MSEPALALLGSDDDRPKLVVRVNFGVFAGRNATQAEIDDLARSLHELVDSFTIVAEERHEFAGEVEAMVRQIVVETDAGADAGEVIARADAWASRCIASRSDLGELSEL